MDGSFSPGFVPLMNAFLGIVDDILNGYHDLLIDFPFPWQDLERIMGDNGGVREKEPFFLSKVDYSEVHYYQSCIYLSFNTTV